MITKHIHIDFIDDVLGTAPGDPDIHGSYVSSKAPDAATKEEEIAAIGEDEFRAKGKTIFPTDERGNPIFWNYQIKGFFKSACAAQRVLSGSKSSKVKAYKKKIDNLVFVAPRMIDIDMSGEMTICERPLRAQTAQGERVALSCSESIPAGSTMEIEITTLTDDLMNTVIEWLDYGKFNGLGQWHNSGKGRFIWEDITNKQ